MTLLSWVRGELLLGRWGATTGWHRMVACRRNGGPDLSASRCRRIQFPAPAFLLIEVLLQQQGPLEGREANPPRYGSAQLSAPSSLRKRLSLSSPLSASCPG